MASDRNIYGYAILDEIHELFPEILYDNVIFPHDGNSGTERILGWLRFRIAQLFPQIFNYAREQYVQSIASQRRNNYNVWSWLVNPLPRTPQIIMSPLQTPLNNNLWGDRNPIYNNTMDEGESRDNTNRLPPIFGQILQNTAFDEILGLTSLLIANPQNRLRGFFEPVIIRPTPEQINNGSQYIESSAVAADTLCAICQDHDSPRDISGSANHIVGWRRLVNCQHIFHTKCINEWLVNNLTSVKCPLCRGDLEYNYKL
jgi:hypothetical protein